MATTREQLHELVDGLSDDRAATVLDFAEALRRGRAVVSVCDPTGANTGAEDQLVSAIPTRRA